MRIISNHYMKRIIAFFAMVLGVFVMQASLPDLYYKGCVPADGSVISSLEFDLEFDLSEIYELFERNDNMYLSITPAPFYDGVLLIRGDAEGGEVIQSIYGTDEYGIRGSTQYGERIHLSFDNNLMIDGQRYSIVFYGIIRCYDKKSGSNYSKKLDYSVEPLILSFTAKTEKQNFGIKNTSLDQISESDNLGKLAIEFSRPVEISDGASAKLLYLESDLYKQNSIYRESNKIAEVPIHISENSPCQLLMDFGNINLYKGVVYFIKINGNSITETENETPYCPDFIRILKGSKKEYFEASHLIPLKDDDGFVNGFSITYSSDNHSIISSSFEQTDETTAIHILDKDGNMAGRIVLDRGNWPEQNYKIEGCLCPDHTYTIRGEEGIVTGTIQVSDQNFRCKGGIINKEFKFTLVAPSIDETTHMPEIKYGEIGLSEFNEPENKIESGYATDYIGTVDIIMEEYWYRDVCYWPWPHFPQGKGEFYEITESGPELIKEIILKGCSRGNTGFFNLNGAVECIINEPLYKGKEYRLVIPENTLGVTKQQSQIIQKESYFSYYVPSPRYEFTFYGLAEPTDNLIDLSPENADAPVDVYNIYGSLLKSRVNCRKALDGLHSGIYILGGKKIIKR